MNRYVDYAVTDILQMVGQANRPVLDTNGKCIIILDCTECLVLYVNHFSNCIHVSVSYVLSAQVLYYQHKLCIISISYVLSAYKQICVHGVRQYAATRSHTRILFMS